MSSKLLVIIATGENEKALTGLMYAHRTLGEGWMDMFQWFFSAVAIWCINRRVGGILL